MSDKLFAVRSVFPGDGEMARLCRALDWSATPLGPVSEWPGSLKALVRTLLTSRHPMFLFWGPELVQIYNDAFRPSLGAEGRHPAALGDRGRVCWAEIWAIIGPQIEQILAGGPATWHENQLVPITRDGHLDEAYWTYSYSPVHGDEGQVEGVLVVTQETTRFVTAERQARALATRLSTVFESITDAFFTLGPDWRFSFVNAEAERLLQRGRDALLGRNVWSEFPEAVDSTFHREYARAMREGVAVQFEAEYAPLQSVFRVHANPSSEGLAVHFQDVPQPRRMEAQLRERERLLSIAGRMARIGAWDVDLATQRVTWSDEVCDIHEVPHGTSPVVQEGIDFYAPEWQPVIARHFAACATDGRPFDLTMQILTANGRRVWVRAIGEAVRDADGAIVRVQGAFQDIQQLRRRRRRWSRASGAFDSWPSRCRSSSGAPSPMGGSTSSRTTCATCRA